VANLGTLTLIVAAAGLVVFLTELTSNLATTATFLPVIAAIAAQSGIEPLILCVPCRHATECHCFLLGRFNYPGNGACRIRHEPCSARGAYTAGYACSAIGFLIL